MFAPVVVSLFEILCGTFKNVQRSLEGLYLQTKVQLCEERLPEKERGYLVWGKINDDLDAGYILTRNLFPSTPECRSPLCSVIQAHSRMVFTVRGQPPSKAWFLAGMEGIDGLNDVVERCRVCHDHPLDALGTQCREDT